jgi:hypothetical protein
MIFFKIGICLFLCYLILRILNDGFMIKLKKHYLNISTIILAMGFISIAIGVILL